MYSLIWSSWLSSEVAPSGSDGKESACNEGYSREDPGEGNGTPLQCSCLENPTDREAWWAAVCGVSESDTTERLTPPLSQGSVITPVLHLHLIVYINWTESQRG